MSIKFIRTTKMLKINLTRTIAAAVLSCAALGAQAFNISYTSENPTLSGRDLFVIADQISDQTGWNIPAHDKVRVDIYSTAEWEASEGRYLYFHQIRLQRLVTGLVAPYSGDYWMTVYTTKSWGIGSQSYMHQRLRGAVRDFFEGVKHGTTP